MERPQWVRFWKALAKRRRTDSVLYEFLEALRKAAGMQDVSSEEAFACDVCDHRVTSRDDFCRGCGAPVPLRNCGVCGAERQGKRYHCIRCSASLLPRIAGRRNALQLADKKKKGLPRN